MLTPFEQEELEPQSQSTNAYSSAQTSPIFQPHASSIIMPQSNSQATLNLNGGVSSQIYSAVYSGVAVFEMMINDVAVMRRRRDSFMNATQILKVGGIEKGKRTKILEKVLLLG
jgi:hypothetical protein